MFAAVAAAARRRVLVVPTDADVERMTVDARFFLAALEGLSDADVERVGAAVSVARGRSLPRAGAALRHCLGPRPRAARARVRQPPG